MQRLDQNARNLGTNIPGQKQIDYTVCECGNSWFEEFRVSRVSKLHMVIPGQEVPKVGSGPFVLLRCVKCNEIYEPNLTAATTAHIRVYNELMEELRADSDKEETTSPPIHPSAPATEKDQAAKLEESKAKKTTKKTAKKTEEAKAQ